MVPEGGLPGTWLYVACFVLCGCGGAKRPAAVSGSPSDAGPTAPPPAADGGHAAALVSMEEAGSGPLSSSDGGSEEECEPASCESLGARCGTPEDGCGRTLSCGTCSDTELCEGLECRSCVPKRCGELGWQCGSGSDGCAGIVDCGSCPGSAVDGGGERCLDHACCSPSTCPFDACGEVSDGCGGSLDCGPCQAQIIGRVCGHVSAMVCLGPEADAQPGCSCELPAVCDLRNGNCCVPLVCPELCKTGAYDGSDGCGATIHCDACMPPKK